MDLSKFTDAELDWLINNGGALVGEETRRRLTPAGQQKYTVECTVSMAVSAPSVRALLDRIAEEGWTVFTLLDGDGGSSGSMYVRDYYTNAVLGEV